MDLNFDKSIFSDKEMLLKYYNVKNPATGKRYLIPLLKTTDPLFMEKYAYAMWLKENQPEAFDALINWR